MINLHAQLITHAKEQRQLKLQLPTSLVSAEAWEKFTAEVRLIRAYPMPREIEPQICRGGK